MGLCNGREVTSVFSLALYSQLSRALIGSVNHGTTDIFKPLISRFLINFVPSDYFEQQPKVFFYVHKTQDLETMSYSLCPSATVSDEGR
jgi:hypothetical protein